MILYVLDITGQQPDSSLLEEDAVRADIVWMNKELFRACTTRRYVMQLYYNMLIELIGKYVTMEVYEYQSTTSYDDRDEEPPDEIVATLARTLYNTESPGGRTLNSLSTLIAYPLGDNEDELFIIPNAVNELYVDTELGHTMPELDMLDILGLLFTKIGEYVTPINNDPDIVTLKYTLREIVPTLVLDFYDTSARYSICPVRLEMAWFRSLSFIL